ncbi:MAG: transporter substrate-binding domain-containing protein [Sulfurospirillaceae bacterium]|nr:transporter substrate-binding domain-containing protein [Sulfurospirillaceae bacterium]
MRFFWLIFCFLFLGAITLDAKAKDDFLTKTERFWLSKNQTITLASAGDYDYLASLSPDGKIIGFDADLIAQINKNLQTSITLKIFDGWDSAYVSAKKGEVDGILSISPTKEREDFFNFSPVYHHDATYIVTKKGEHYINNIGDFNGRTVIVEKNNIINKTIEMIAPNAKVITASNVQDILKAVQEGTADGTILEGMANYDLQSLGLKISGSLFVKSGEYTIGTHKSKPILAKIIEKGIHSISKSQMQEMKNRWFQIRSEESLFSSEELAYIQNAPTLKIGVEDWAPMISSKDGKTIEGITGELLNRVLQISGLKTELLLESWSSLLHRFKNKEIDILPATYYTDERATYGLFGDSYTKIKNLLYVNRDNQDIKSLSDMEGKTLVVQKGFGTIPKIKQKFPKIKIIEVDGLENAILKVSNGEADALFEAQIVAQDIIQKLLITNLKPIFQNDIEANALHIFSKKDDLLLHSILNKSLQSISPQEKNNIIDKWLHQDIKRSVNIVFSKNEEPYVMENAFAKGIEYDIVKEILSKKDVLVSYEKFISPEKILNILQEDEKIDVVVGINPQNGTFYYSEPLVDFEYIAISRIEDKLKINSIEDLKKKKIIAFKDAYKTLGEKYNTLFNPTNRPETYTEISTQDEQVTAFLNKKADVIILDKNMFQWYLKSSSKKDTSKYKFHTIFDDKNSHCIAFKDKNLRDLFNESLQDMKKSGKYNQIVDNYLYTDIESKTKMSFLVASLAAKHIFTEDIKKLKEIVLMLSKLPYLDKIDIFNNENELLVTHVKGESGFYVSSESFYSLSQMPQKVGYVHLYFDEKKLFGYGQNNTIIPDVSFFNNLRNYAEIKEVYKKLDFLGKPSFTQKEEEFIKNHPILRFSSVSQYPLYINENGTPEGLHNDFLKFIEAKSGILFEHIDAKNQKDLYEKLQSKKVDLIVNAKTTKLEKPFEFSSIVFEKFYLAIVANKEFGFVDGIGEFKGSVAISSNCVACEMLREKYPNIKVIETKNTNEALSLVAQKKVDASIGHEVEMTHYLKNYYTNLKIIGTSKEIVSHYFATHLEYPELISIVNKVLESLSYEQKKKIKDMWFITKVQTEVDRSIVYRVAFGLILVITLIIIYNQRLKHLVSEKTVELAKLLSSFDSNVIAIRLDESGKIIYASKALCNMVEYSQEELIGNTTNVITNKTNKRILKDFRRAFLNKQPWSGKLINASKSGRVYWTKTKLFQEYDEKGNFLNHTIISQDITAQKEVEALSKEIEETQKEVIFKMGAIAEARSQETGQHVKRVAEYSRLLAIHYGLSSEEANRIKLASPMHDIGKVAIADSILGKPSALSTEEFEIIKTHAQIGYDMLKNSQRNILKTASIIAHEHHEKYDGTGYPRGLKGEDIHIYGRITAVADVFDALGSKRVYKEAWEDNKIFMFFKEQSGKHFDPKLIDIFFTNLKKFLDIRDSFRDA